MGRVVVIGLGGIGTNLVESVSRCIVFSGLSSDYTRILLVDGDKYEERNRERQRFGVCANKAEATKEWLLPLFPELVFEAKPYFMDSSNVFALIREGDLVFLAVDNHATRKAISQHLCSLNNVWCVSGGNDLYDGNVQVYQKKDGKELFPPFTWRHPEIEHPKDKNPAEKSCEELAQAGEPQLLSVNDTIASLMLGAFTQWFLKLPRRYHEVYFDIRTGNVRPVYTEWPLTDTKSSC